MASSRNDIREQDSLLLTGNLLRIAIYNISYIRGLFHEKYFSDKSVPALEMKIKKLMPMDAESRRLIDWMEKGVYDALQKKYLKTLLFCICEKEEGPMIEEYAFSFSYPNTSTEEVAMNMSRTGSKKGSTTFTSNSSEVTPDQMRSSACKMIRTLVSLMRTLDPMPEERTILMKLLYYDDVTPEDYEPPFFKGCAENEAINIWNKNSLKMEVGNVKSVFDPCDDNNVNSGDDGMSVDNESYQDGDFSDTEVRPSGADHYVVAPNDGKCKGQSTGTISEDDTQDAAHEEELGAINVSDVLSNFPDISLEMVEDIMERLLKDGVPSRASKDSYTINQIVDPKTPHIKKEVIMQNVSPIEGTKHNNDDLIYVKALYHALPMDYVTIAKLQGKLDGEANQNMVRKLIDKMVQDGYVKNSANRRLGKAVIHSESSNRKLLEIKRILEGNDGKQMVIDTNTEHAESERKELLKVHEMRDGSTMGCQHSIGSDLTRTWALPQLQQNVSMQSGQEASATDKDLSRTPTSAHELDVPVCSLESEVLGQKIKRPLTGGSEVQFIQGKRSRKSTMQESACVTGLILCTNPTPTIHYWNLDSGATRHICGRSSWLKNLRDIPDNEQYNLMNGNDQPIEPQQMGDIIGRRLRLYNVCSSNDIGDSELYISVGQLTDDGYHVHIVNGKLTIHLPQNINHIVGVGSLDPVSKAYLVSFFNDSVLDRSKSLRNVSDVEDNGEYKVAEGPWLLDSGAPRHSTNNISLLSDIRRLRKTKGFRFAGKGEVICNTKGNVTVSNLKLKNVYWSDGFSGNLMSVRKLNGIGYNFFYSGNVCNITYKEEQTLAGLAHKDAGNSCYYVEFLYSKD